MYKCLYSKQLFDEPKQVHCPKTSCGGGNLPLVIFLVTKLFLLMLFYEV